LSEKKKVFPYLEIKPPQKLELYQDIAMCGYPAGTQTLNFIPSNYRGMRMNPMIHFGKIVGFIPIDETPDPNAVQTDIISTGGSSGSPIIALDTYEVIGLAQQVIGASVVGDKPSPITYTAKIGPVYGVTNHQLHTVAGYMKDYFEKGIQPNTRLPGTNVRLREVRLSPANLER